MKITLIASTPFRSDGVLLKQRRLWMPGLTLPMIAALTPEDVEVHAVNETIEGVDFEEDVDLVGISSMGGGIIRAWQIADEFRSRGKTVVMGGIMASLSVKQSLEHCDSVLIGDAEEVWPRIISDARKGSLENTYQSESMNDLSNLPVPRYNIFPKTKIGFWLPVQAGRGCPYRCDFCSITSFYRGIYRKRPVHQVARDVEAVLATGTRKVLLLDDNIGSDPAFAYDIFQMLRAYHIQWMTQCSLTIAQRPELLKLAADSGCVCMSFGLETLCQENLGTVNKNFARVADYEEAIRKIRDAGIDVSTEMMFGMDHDDPGVFDATVEFLIRNRISVPRLHIITPIPGTPLFDRWEAEGRIFDHEWSNYTGGRVVFHPKKMSAERLQSEYWRAYERLFALHNLFRRFFLKKRIRGFLVPLFLLAANFHYRKHIRQRVCPGIV